MWAFMTFTAVLYLAQVLPLAQQAEDTGTLLETLFQLATGYIAVGKIQVEDVTFDLSTYGHNIYVGAEVHIQTGHLSFQNQLAQIKELAAQNNQDIRECLTGRESELTQFLAKYLTALDLCVENISGLARQLQDDATYRIDVLMTQVNSLQFQFLQCASTNETCFSIVAENTKELTLTIENKVQAEVVSYAQDADVMKGDTDSCSAVNVSGFNANSKLIINEIAQCIA